MTLIKIPNLRSLDVSSTPDAMWRRDYCCFSCAGTSEDTAERSVAALTRVFVWRLENDLLWNPYNGIVRGRDNVDGSWCDNGRSILRNCPVRMITCFECHDMTLQPPGNISKLNRFKNSVLRSTSTAIFSTVPNHTLTCSSPIRTKRKIILKFCKVSFTTPRSFGADWYLVLVDPPFYRKVIWRMLWPTSVSRRHNYRCTSLVLVTIWNCTLYAGFEKSATVADVTWKWHFFANITD